MITHKTLLQSQMRSVWYFGLLSLSTVNECSQSRLCVLSVFMMPITGVPGNQGRHNQHNQQVNREDAFDHLSQRMRHTLSYSPVRFQTESSGEVNILAIIVAANLLCLSQLMKPQATVTLNLVRKDGSGRTAAAAFPSPPQQRREGSFPTEPAHLVLTQTPAWLLRAWLPTAQ